MRIAIMGAGGIGAYYGACLARAGNDVSFIARGAHLSVLQQKGLRIQDFGGEEFTLQPVTATDDPATIGPVHVILLCVKMYDISDAIALCAPMVDNKTMIVTLQNGVEAVDMVDAQLGTGRALGGAAYVAAGISAPGVIHRNNQMSTIEFGESDGTISPRAKSFCKTLIDAGIEAHISTDVKSMLWSKFVLMTSNACLTSLSRVDTGFVKADPVMRSVYLTAMQETIAVGRAHGVNFPDDIIERTLAWLDNSAPIMASLAVDLINGRRLEVEWLSGAVHRFGIETGIPTPIHTTVYAALRPHINGTT